MDNITTKILKKDKLKKKKKLGFVSTSNMEKIIQEGKEKKGNKKWIAKNVIYWIKYSILKPKEDNDSGIIIRHMWVICVCLIVYRFMEI